MSDIYRYKEIWPIKITSNYLGTKTFYNRTIVEEDLQVFIPNTDMIEESIKEFVEMYSLRRRTSREYWLLDIGYWTANVEDRTSFYKEIRYDLRNLDLDLDDDLYFFEGKTMLEYYDRVFFINIFNL
jgi:hypothetical protein